MEQPIELKLMDYLSERLAASLGDLAEFAGQPEEQVRPTLEQMEREQLIHRVTDSVRGQVLFAPTPRGILKSRQRSRSVY